MGVPNPGEDISYNDIVQTKPTPKIESLLPEERRHSLNELKNEILFEKTSHEKVKEIQSLLENISFDDSIRKMVDSVLQTKKIPADIMKNATEQYSVEQGILTQIGINMDLLTPDDKKIAKQLLFGDLDKFYQAVSLLPHVVVEIPRAEGKILKIPGTYFQSMFSKLKDN